MAYVKVDSSWDFYLRAFGLSSFDDFFTAPGVPIGRHATRHVAPVAWGRLRAFLKREDHCPWKDRLASWWAGFGFVSKSRREWNVLHALHRCRIPCPRPVAVGENQHRAFLVVEELVKAVDLCTYLRSGHCLETFDRDNLSRTLGRTLAQFHASGFTHPDLYAKHVFIHVHDHTACFIDFQRTRYRWRVSWRQRWRDLAALDASLAAELVSPRDRLLFLTAYLRAAAPKRRRILFRQALWAIARRTGHLLRRKKIRAMRQEAARLSEDVPAAEIASASCLRTMTRKAAA